MERVNDEGELCSVGYEAICYHVTVEAEQLSEVIQPLVEELKAIREVLAETQQDIQHLTRNIQDYLSAIADSSDEIRQEILARVRYDDLPKPLLAPEETVTCAHCDVSADSLAEAVRRGFTALQPDSSGVSWNYLAECPECAATMNDVSKQGQLF